MPQINKQHITLGGNRIVGNVWVDGGNLRGEGNPSGPQLVVPLTIQMHNMPAGAPLALCWLRARLSMNENAWPHTTIGHPATELLSEEFPARSFPAGSAEHTVELRFDLSPADIEGIETQRHATPSDVFKLYLGIDAVVAGLRTYNQFPPAPGTEKEHVPWPIEYGMLSQLLPFWSTKISPVSVAVERSSWVRVLPGLGYDRRRLIEIPFPPPLPDHASAASEWDKARQALDEQRYSDCVAECRDLLAMWQNQLQATKKRRVATVVAERRGWTDTDGRTSLLDGVWKAAIDIVNTPHHPERQLVQQEFDAADARLMLTLTAALSSYIN
jgi:hypothetical protein